MCRVYFCFDSGVGLTIILLRGAIGAWIKNIGPTDAEET